MKKHKSKRYKQAYSIRVALMLPGPLSEELEQMMGEHELKLGPLVARLALRGLLEYRRDGRLGKPGEIGLPAYDSDEAAPPMSAGAGRARTAVQRRNVNEEEDARALSPDCEAAPCEESINPPRVAQSRHRLHKSVPLIISIPTLK